MAQNADVLKEIRKMEDKISKLRNMMPMEDRQGLYCYMCKYNRGQNDKNPRFYHCAFSNELVDTAQKCPTDCKLPRFKITCSKCGAEVAKVSASDKDPLKDKINLKHYFFCDNPNYKNKGLGCPSVTKNKLTFECFCGNDNRKDMKKDKFKITKIKD